MTLPEAPDDPVASTETIAERCVADSTCTVIFHEPLNANDGTSISDPYNPTDTAASQTISRNAAARGLDMVPMTGDADSPSVTIPGRSYVLRSNGASRLEVIPASESGAGYDRMCSGVYFFHDSGDITVGDSPACASDQRYKLITYQFDSNTVQWTVESSPASGCVAQEIGVNHNLAALGYFYSTTATLAISESTWVRLEACVETNGTANLDTNTPIRAEFRITRVDTGAEELVQFGWPPDTYASPGGGMSEARINFDRQGPDNELYWSTAFQLGYDTPDDQWPGPDCNIEPTAAECL